MARPATDAPVSPGRVELVAALFGALLIGIGAVSLRAAHRGDWVKVFIPAGLRLRSGLDIFRDGYVYPPFQALLAAPFSWANPTSARWIWAALNVTAAGVFLMSAWRLSGGRITARDSRRLPREAWTFALGFAAAIGFLFDAVSNGQTDLLLAALITGGYLWARRWPVAGAASIGIAAGAKCTPLLFVPWLVLRRRWLAAGTVLIAALTVNLLPDLLFPTPNGELRLVTWNRNYLAGLLGQKYQTGTWYTAPEFNHSLAGLLHRLAPAAIVQPVWLLGCAVLLILTFLAILRARRRENIIARAVERFELGMIFCLMLLLSPASSKPHFCTLLLPAWALARSAIYNRSRWLWTIMIVVVVAGLLANKDLFGAHIYDAAKWWGVITFETLLLYGACLWAHWRANLDGDFIDKRIEDRY